MFITAYNLAHMDMKTEYNFARPNLLERVSSKEKLPLNTLFQKVDVLNFYRKLIFARHHIFAFQDQINCPFLA